MRIPSVDTLRGLAIFSVVVIHTEPFLANESLSRDDWYYVGNALQQLASFAIPFFFVAAGYFFSQGIGSDGLRKRWWQYTSRLFRVLLFWIVVDGVFSAQWLRQIITAKSLAPLYWNLRGIPSFALAHVQTYSCFEALPCLYGFSSLS